jgi:hypothetical protein
MTTIIAHSSFWGVWNAEMDVRRRPRKRLQYRLVVATGMISAAAYLLIASKILVHRSPNNNNAAPNRPGTSRRTAAATTATSRFSLSADRPEKKVQQRVPKQLSLAEAEQLSSVDYMACCGAGHRTSKLAEASYLAKVLLFGLRVYWGYCDTYDTRQRQTEVFQYV